MARTNNLSNFLTDVASAIKTKKGSETNIPAANFDTEILALPSQGTYEQRVLNISANGTQTITPSSGYDAIDELELTVAVPEKQLQSKTYNFIQNTNIQLLPDSGYDGFDTVTLNINVPSSGDTSDATATAEDLIEGTTAYVKGEKIEGTLEVTDAISIDNSNNTDTHLTLMNMGNIPSMVIDADITDFHGTKKAVEDGTGLEIIAPQSQIANAINLTAEKIVSGNTILDIEGTGGGGDVKLFETVEEMQEDPDASEGDLAVVYRSEVQPCTATTHFSKAIFPETVVLDSALEDSVGLMFRPVDSSQEFECGGMMDQSMFEMSCYGEQGEYRIQYESQDGLTYTRTIFRDPEGDVTGNELDFGVEIHYEDEEMWNDVIGEFVQVDGSYFEGLYEYKTYIDKDTISIPLMSGISNITSSSCDYDGTRSPEFDLTKIKEMARQICIDEGISSGEGGFNITYKNNHIILLTVNEGGSLSSPFDTAYNVQNKSFNIYSNYNTSGSIYEYVLDLDNNTYTKNYIGQHSPVSQPPYAQYNYTLEGFMAMFVDYGDGRGYNFNGTPNSIYYIDGSTYSHSQINNAPSNYFVEKTNYKIADSQLTLSSLNQLLLGVKALGRNGVVEGDGSIYSNLDWTTVYENFLLGKPAYGEYLSYIGFPSTTTATNFEKNDVISIVENTTTGKSYLPFLDTLHLTTNTYSSIDISGFSYDSQASSENYTVLVFNNTSNTSIDVYARGVTTLRILLFRNNGDFIKSFDIPLTFNSGAYYTCMNNAVKIKEDTATNQLLLIYPYFGAASSERVNCRGFLAKAKVNLSSENYTTTVSTSQLNSNFYMLVNQNCGFAIYDFYYDSSDDTCVFFLPNQTHYNNGDSNYNLTKQFYLFRVGMSNSSCSVTTTSVTSTSTSISYTPVVLSNYVYNGKIYHIVAYTNNTPKIGIYEYDLTTKSMSNITITTTLLYNSVTSTNYNAVIFENCYGEENHTVLRVHNFLFDFDTQQYEILTESEENNIDTVYKLANNYIIVGVSSSYGTRVEDLTGYTKVIIIHKINNLYIGNRYSNKGYDLFTTSAKTLFDSLKTISGRKIVTASNVLCFNNDYTSATVVPLYSKQCDIVKGFSPNALSYYIVEQYDNNSTPRYVFLESALESIDYS